MAMKQAKVATEAEIASHLPLLPKIWAINKPSMYRQFISIVGLDFNIHFIDRSGSKKT